MAKQTNDSGFSQKAKAGAAHIINKDGSSNVVHLNRKFQLDDLYSYMIEISWLHFFCMVVFGYILVNLFFASVYMLIGIEELSPKTDSLFLDFLNGFFFSAQTITTVGYGGISPHGVLAGVVSTFEALIGLLSFSFITGLLYGRFSKPKSAINFSRNILIRDFKEHRALMFRLMNNRKNIMIEPQINVTLSLSEKDENGLLKRVFYQLDLERNKIMYLPVMWTVVHEIDPESPLFKYSNEEMKALDAEVYIMAKYHEETFSQQVYQMYTYNFADLILDEKFVSNYNFDENGKTILDHNSLNLTEKM